METQHFLSSETATKGVPLPRILAGPQQVCALPRGLKAGDFHVHTYFSEDVLPVSASDPLRLYELAIRRGLRYFSFTDHDTMDAYDRVGWQREGLVPGVEVRLLDRKNVGHTIHVNVYLLNRLQFKELMGIANKEASFENFLDFLQAEQLPHIYNHPFWFERGEKPNVGAVLEIARLFPVLEYNRGRTRSLNRLALALAQQYGKGIVACSDAHTARSLGSVRTYAAGDTFREYFENVSRGRSWILTQDMTTRGLVEEANEWIRQLFAWGPVRTIQDPVPADLGPKKLGWLLGLLARDGVVRNNLFWRAIERFLYALSNSAVIQSRYIRSQETLALHIMKEFPFPFGHSVPTPG